MKRQVNLLEFYPQSKRPIADRGNLITEQDRAIARKFDIEYFDGERKIISISDQNIILH